jgi:ribonucleoside-diphosphate reductase alpha chain
LITARTLVEEEPNYSYASARLLLDELRTESLTFLNVTGSGEMQTATQAQMTEFYPLALKGFIDRGVELELISPRLQTYDFALLGALFVQIATTCLLI